ncbi:MAG: polysaccharide deacetylase family protein [Tissierellia bacterium]|nr:polysaccharide deacetylase family protein [Tissierellia bacterium]
MKKNRILLTIAILSILTFIVVTNISYAKNTGDRIPVLMYHHIIKENNNNLETFENSSIISLEQFKREMGWLKENGYSTITTNDLYEFIVHKKALPPSPVLITFDDGYKSNIELAYPVLKENGQKAAIFVIGHAVEDASSASPIYHIFPFLNFYDMLNTTDVFEFHNHTYDLHKFENVKPKLVTSKKEEIIKDFQSYGKILNHESFSYPYGAYNNRTIKILKNFNYKTAFTTRPAYAYKNTDPYKIPRFGISSKTTMEEFIAIVSGQK